MILISVAFMIFVFEYAAQFKTKYLFTCYMVIGIFIQIFTNDFDLSNFLMMTFAIPIFFFASLAWYFVFIKPVPKNLKKHMILSYFGMLSFAASLVGRNNLFNEYIRVLYSISTIISIIGVCLIGYGFSGLTTFSDINWKEKLRELFIIYNKSGICLYAYSFDEENTMEDKDTGLIGGGFQGIQAMLSEIVQTKESLQMIDYKNLKVMLEQGEYATFVLILKSESMVLKYKIKLLSDEFHNFFKETLEKFDGETMIFNPSKAIIERIFELSI